MNKIIILISLVFFQACVVPVTIGNTIETNETSGKKRPKNSPEMVSPEIYNVVGDYQDFIVLMANFEPGKSDNMHYHGNLLY